jgi:hypothetical protein
MPQKGVRGKTLRVSRTKSRSRMNPWVGVDTVEQQKRLTPYMGCREGSCYQPQTTAFSLVSGVSRSGAMPITDRLHRSIFRLLTWGNEPDLRLMTATFTTPRALVDVIFIDSARTAGAPVPVAAGDRALVRLPLAPTGIGTAAAGVGS